MYVGPIRCPNCHAPIADDVAVCPYCHSSSPMSAPWNQGQWTTLAVLACGVALLAVADYLIGTDMLPSLWRWLSADG